MIQIVNIYVTRDSGDFPWEQYLKGKEVGQEALNALLDDGYTVLHSSVLKDLDGQFTHFVLYKPTHLIELDRETAELDAARVTANGQHFNPPLVRLSNEDTFSEDDSTVRYTLTEETTRFLDELSRKNGSAALD